jgi:hypothetical protein
VVVLANDGSLSPAIDNLSGEFGGNYVPGARGTGLAGLCEGRISRRSQIEKC